ncbi:MAG TPA: hypothetical protein VL523_20125 [Terriglobia bacterium]|nr:hypothetical protein [Terriglobia bacterium]
MLLRRLSWILATALLLPPNLPAAGVAGNDKLPATYTIPLPPKPDFSALSWLVGDWAGPATELGRAKNAPGNVHLTLSYALEQRYVLVREEIALPAGSSAPAVHETWMGFLSSDPSGPGFTLRSFSSTGFMTQYHVSVTESQVRFDPEGGANPPAGWLFRRIISRLAPGYYSETVEVAPPGGTFFQYYSAKLTQVIEPSSSPQAPASPKPSGTR